MKNYKDILTSKNTIFTIIIVVGLGLLIGLVIHQEHIQAERGNIALSKQHKDGQDVEQVKNAIKNFNIDSETIIEDWKKIQELKPTTDEGKKTLTDFLTSTADKITNHYTEKALKLDIKESDSQFEDKQALETAITSLQKILEIIKSVNSTSEQATIDEKIKPIQELISKFQKQAEVLTKKEEEQKSNKKETETTSNVEGRESYSSEGGSYTPNYTESNRNRYNSQAPASEQYSSDSARSGGNTAVNTRDQVTDTAGAQGDTNTNNNSNNAEVPDANSNNRTNSAGETPESRQP
ncbi:MULTISPECIES: hypothetical protein [Streptococcus]|uniref:Uncharacterized protein n=1 Tax=Streptococcus mitis TaxID=28037 RepID=A0A150NV85_STRMT|nr:MULTISPECIES: hypothetical protein [Streptococcus]KYF33416.1 hypothetical protein SMIM3I_02048 [Streptococcus mitis]KYF37328.1 hypothetical protein SMIM3IV_01798 [Streptococcus mitis]MBT2163799.1 hypothetical protein [Streptococcus mitis]OFN93955.1 hypothetical protein HMPREF2701_06190 [Streptococcus sp. HMSC077D04]RSI84700.1 hypothetical protein D8855_00590 [Streptococcus mitis]